MTTRARNGVRYPAGLRVRPRAEQRLKQQMSGLYRGVVINTYTPDEDQNPTDYQVYCDVVLFRTKIPLPMVPVAMPMGVNNAASWIPKPTTKTLSGVPLNLTLFSRKGEFQGSATAFEDMDGDHVLVQFVEGSHQFPIITGKITHQSTKRTAVKGSGWSDGLLQDEQRGHPEKDEAYFRHGGTEVRINKSGDVLVDTVGATEDDVEEIPLPISGDVRFRMKRGRKLIVNSGSIGGVGGLGGEEMLSLTHDELGNMTAEFGAAQVKLTKDVIGNVVVSLGDDKVKLTVPAVGPALLDLLGATQPFVRGSDLQAALTALTTALNAYALALGPVPPPPGPPVPVTTAITSPATTALATAILAFEAQVTAALSLTIKGE